MLSIVIPIQNERNNPYLTKQLGRFRQLDAQVLFVGMADEETKRQIVGQGFEYLKMAGNRAQKLAAGIVACQRSNVLLHHPRSVISLAGYGWLQQSKLKTWGGFTHRFDQDHLLLQFTSWYSNRVRSKRGIVYLDHCLFAPKAWLQQITIEAVDVFEDTLISRELRQRFSRPMIHPEPATTSAIRFSQQGVYWRSLHNQWLKGAFYFGQHHTKLNRAYERDLALNGTAAAEVQDEAVGR